MAHDKQAERALMDLRSLYSGQVMIWKRNNIPYARQGVLQPLGWSFREIFFARPVEGFMRMALQMKRSKS